MSLSQLRLLPGARLGFWPLISDLLTMAVRFCRCGMEGCDMIAEWIGEFRLRERLLEKADAMRAIRFAD